MYRATKSLMCGLLLLAGTVPALAVAAEAPAGSASLPPAQLDEEPIKADPEAAKAEKESTPPPKPAVVTQRDLATRLIQELNLGSLPKKAKEKDLQRVLSGGRTLTIEAEDHFDKKRDRVTVRTFKSIGAFSGRGWIGAPAEQTPVTFRARIPLAGVYRLKVTGAGDGHLWSIGGKAIKLDFGPQLKEVDAGTVILDPELMTFTVMLPPDGAVDAITLTAPDLPAIQPAVGWQFDAPLTYGVAADVAVSLLKDRLAMENIPAIPPRRITMAGNAALPAGVSLVTDPIYGKFYGEGWFRNGYNAAQVVLPFKVDQSAFYGVRVLWFGKLLSGTLDRVIVERPGKPYLEWVDLGVHYLAKGDHRLQLELPPYMGVDSLELTAKVSGTPASMKLLGWQQSPTDQVLPPDFDRLVKDLVTRYQASGR